MRAFFRLDYHPLDESKRAFSPNRDEEHEFASPHDSVYRKHRNWTTAIFLVSNIVLFLISVVLFSEARRDRTCKNETETGYTPLLQAVSANPKTTLLDGTFWSNTSIFRQDPSPEVDAAWSRIAATYITTAPSSAILSAGKDPRKIVKAPASWGLGDDAYPVDIDALHQVHCLNALRKDIFYEYYYGALNRSHFYLAHRSHCIHILLQNLMCKSDAEIITMKWVREESTAKERPWPDFSVVKRCGDFEALVEWAMRNEVKDSEEKRMQLRMPSDGSVTAFHDM